MVGAFPDVLDAALAGIAREIGAVSRRVEIVLGDIAEVLQDGCHDTLDVVGRRQRPTVQFDLEGEAIGHLLRRHLAQLERQARLAAFILLCCLVFCVGRQFELLLHAQQADPEGLRFRLDACAAHLIHRVRLQHALVERRGRQRSGDDAGK